MGSNTGPNVSSVAKFSAYKGSALHLFRGGTVVLVALALTALTAAPTPAEEVQPQLSKASSTPPTAPELTIDGFLDRLMMAESGGNDAARNQRSTALGPFQFIKSTFVEVARRHFAEETATLSPSAIGAQTDPLRDVLRKPTRRTMPRTSQAKVSQQAFPISDWRFWSDQREPRVCCMRSLTQR